MQIGGSGKKKIATGHLLYIFMYMSLLFDFQVCGCLNIGTAVIATHRGE